MKITKEMFVRSVDTSGVKVIVANTEHNISTNEYAVAELRLRNVWVLYIITELVSRIDMYFDFSEVIDNMAEEHYETLYILIQFAIDSLGLKVSTQITPNAAMFSAGFKPYLFKQTKTIRFTEI
jgi:hypothetical protein